MPSTGRSFYTYQLKTSKGQVVVVRGIEPDVDPDEIKSALQDHGFEIRSVVNILNRSKLPQPLFKVELQPDARKPKKGEIHPIYKLRYLLHRKISVEEPLKPKGPIQCQNCQEYGHTKAYCTLPTVCVACGDLHQSVECNVNTQEQKKCSNCGGNHTANYRGCPVYKELKGKLNTRRQTLRAQTPPETFMDVRRPPDIPIPNVSGNSYANVTRTGIVQPLVQPPSGIESMIQQLMQSMTMFISSMQSMMQEFMRNQNHLLQTLLAKK